MAACVYVYIYICVYVYTYVCALFVSFGWGGVGFVLEFLRLAGFKGIKA